MSFGLKAWDDSLNENRGGAVTRELLSLYPNFISVYENHYLDIEEKKFPVSGVTYG